jgi:hypothetical protein
MKSFESKKGGVKKNQFRMLHNHKSLPGLHMASTIDRILK